jgi:RecJ-like exonuclease
MSPYYMQVRCPVCNGTGAVEPSFQSGMAKAPGETYTAGVSCKVCPACHGVGMQAVIVE